MLREDYQKIVDICFPYWDMDTDPTCFIWEKSAPKELKEIWKVIKKGMCADGFEIDEFTCEVIWIKSEAEKLMDLQEYEEIKDLL